MERTANSTKSDLKFWYDAMGQRTVKLQKPRNGSGFKPESEWEYTYYQRDASGNVMATYKRSYQTIGINFLEKLELSEQDIYGSSRIGQYKPIPAEGIMAENQFTASFNADNQFANVSIPVLNVHKRPDVGTYRKGDKVYELSNHLGNVLAVVSDRIIPIDYNGDETNTVEFKAEVVSANDYYPFGMAMPGRNMNNGDYRYGFNGKERDPEGLGGGGSTYDYGFRIYNPSLGRFLSIDPLNHNYPFYSPYLYAGNKPIVALDLDGLEELDYKLYAEHMKKGATKLNKVKFRGANPHITNNEYWGTEANGGRLVMKEGKNPAAALNHIFSQPDNYKFGCAEYIQVVMLYGKLQAMGDKKFNEFIKGVDNGKFGIDSYGATGNKVDSQWYINDDGAWVNTKKAWKFKTAKKRRKYREKGERRFNPEKHALNMPIGTKVYLDNTLLGDNHSYDGENMLKVGEDLYIAQFLGDGLLTMDEAKKELAKRSLIAQLAKNLDVKESELTEKQKEDYFKDNLTEDYIEKTVKISSFEEYKTTEQK